MIVTIDVENDQNFAKYVVIWILQKKNPVKSAP